MTDDYAKGRADALAEAVERCRTIQRILRTPNEILVAKACGDAIEALAQQPEPEPKEPTAKVVADQLAHMLGLDEPKRECGTCRYNGTAPFYMAMPQCVKCGPDFPMWQPKESA